MTYQTQGNPAPNWYPDPSGSGGMRYWDGSQWTQHLAPPPPPAAAPAAYPPPVHPAYSPHYPPGPQLALTGGGKVFSMWGFVLGGNAWLRGHWPCPSPGSWSAWPSASWSGTSADRTVVHWGP